jgi:hypothetical protein
MIIDAEAECWTPEYTAEKIAEYNPLLTAIIVLGANPSASSTPKMTATGEILTALKKKAPDTKTILGGLHPSALPERTLREEHVDSAFGGVEVGQRTRQLQDSWSLVPPEWEDNLEPSSPSRQSRRAAHRCMGSSAHG